MGESTNPAPSSVSTAVFGWSSMAQLSPQTQDCWPVASWTMPWD